MGKRKRNQIDSALYPVRFLNIPTEIELYTVVDELAGKLRSITQIYRIYDFANKRRCNDVIATLRCFIEYETLKLKEMVNIRGNQIKMDFSNIYVGSAWRSQTPSKNEIGPVQLQLNKLRKVSDATTSYVREILFGFESTNDRDVVGICLPYDKLSNTTKPFGFVTFNDINAITKYHNNGLRIFEDIYECEIGKRVPVILSENNTSLLKGNPPEFTTEISVANMLSDISLESPEHSDTPATVGVADTLESVSGVEETMDDTESVLSIEFYDFDEEFELIKKL